MNDFWRLISIFLSLITFLVIGGVLLSRGESLDICIFRSVIAALGVYLAQNVLGSILIAVADSKAEPKENAENPGE